MRSTVIFLSGALTGAIAAGLTLSLTDRLESTETAASHTAFEPPLDIEHSLRQNDDPSTPYCCAPALPVEQHATDSAGDSTPVAEPVMERDDVEPEFGAEWNALVAGMLEWEIERRTSEKLSAESKARLLSELARVREASIALEHVPAQPEDPAELRDQLMQTLALVQADQAFRSELGIGVADFLQGLESSVEDISAQSSGR